MAEKHIAAVLTTVGTTWHELGRVSIGVTVVTGPKVIEGREFDATVDPIRARSLAMKLLEAADIAELQARQYGWVPRRGEFDRIAMGM